ncbi:glycoside hydrolase domain-containing protein [Nonomuraea sp. NPDC049480]|uniref:glycoside hydrolase domain-containing protein n=1 Tax=Nonomuraea sp. NPDC049480 TaxID=3364353 RepID=UPI003792C883
MAALLVLLELTVATPAHAAPAVRIWTASAADRVFSTSQPAKSAPTSIDLYSARGEQEAAQIAVRSSSAEALTNVRVAASALTGPGGAGIPTSNILLRRAYDHVKVQVMAGDVERPPDGGTSYYDALVENTPRELPGGVTQPYHYSVTVPVGQAPGVYTGTVVVSTGNGGTATVNVRLVVYNVTLPEPDKSTFKMNNWFTSAGWDYDGTVKSIPAQYGTPERPMQMYDDNWWKVIENIAANHRRHRNNVIYADFQALLIPDTKAGPGGELRFGWTTFDRFIETFVRAGALQYIYTPTLLEGPAPASPEPVNAEILDSVNGVVQRVLVTPDSPEANAYYDRVFPALKAHLDAKGWTDQFYFSALDEPKTQQHVDAANWLYGKYRTYFPNPRTNEAHVTHMPALAGNLTTITPVLSHYEQHMGYYQNLRANGTDLWLYNCIVPEGSQMNRFISYHLAKTRLTPWLTWKIGGTGYLHWGWNYWFSKIRNSTTVADTFDDLQSGDNWLVRPNKAAYDIYDSLRSEAQLDGIEDYELLNMLARTKPLLARLVASSLITNTVAYSRSGAEVDARHKMLLELLVDSGPDRRFPYTDNFSAGDVNWQRGNGSWSVASTGEYLQTDTSNWGFTSTPRSSAYGDVVASVDLKIVAVNSHGGNTNWAGFMIRSSNATDMDTGYLVALRNNGEVFVYRSGKELGHATAGNYQAGTYTRLRVMAFGNKLSVYAGNNRQPLLTVTDDAFPAGHVALVTGGASVRFDNFTVNPDNNMADGRPVTTSSTYSADGWHPTAAADGIQSSTPGSMGWTSAAGASADRTEWITVDLQSKRSLSRIDLFPRSDGANAGMGFPVDFTVQVSADGKSWSAVATHAEYPRPGTGAQSFSFPAEDARYVRVTGTKLSTDPLGAHHMQLAEIEVYGGGLAAEHPASAPSGRSITALSRR